MIKGREATLDSRGARNGKDPCFFIAKELGFLLPTLGGEFGTAEVQESRQSIQGATQRHKKRPCKKHMHTDSQTHAHPHTRAHTQTKTEHQPFTGLLIQKPCFWHISRLWSFILNSLTAARFKPQSPP